MTASWRMQLDPAGICPAVESAFQRIFVVWSAWALDSAGTISANSKTVGLAIDAKRRRTVMSVSLLPASSQPVPNSSQPVPNQAAGLRPDGRSRRVLLPRYGEGIVGASAKFPRDHGHHITSFA